MRNVVYRFEDLASFGRALREADQELVLPAGERVLDGEWVLSIFEVSPRAGENKGRATAAAARGLDRGNGEMALGFERRDWERLVEFADASVSSVKSPEHYAEASQASRDELSYTNQPAQHPVQQALEPAEDDSIPVEIDEEPPTLTKGRSTIPDVDPEEVSVAEVSVPEPLTPEIPRPPATPSMTPLRTHGLFASSGPKARVLVVDDDRDIREVVSAMLDAVGLLVEVVGSAEEALERVRAQVYDMVVLDWNLPGMTGIELCRIVRRDPTLASLPVLFLTAQSSSKDVVEAFASGADDYVIKPFRAPELGARIFGLLRRMRVAQASP